MLDRLKPIATAMLLTGAIGAAPALAQDDAPSADTVVATVNGTDITIGHMLTLRAGLPEQFQQVPPDVLFPGILDQLVQQTLLEQDHEGDLPRRAKLTLENERRALVASEKMADISESAVTDEAVQTYFDENYVNGEDVTEYHAAHILVEDEDEAKKLAEEARDGGDFAKLAEENSTGPSAASGGDIGWFSDGMMVAPFYEAVEKMDKGDISDPVETQFGWHVIKLEDSRVKDAPKLEEVRGEIEQALRQKAIQDEITKLEKDSDVDRSKSEGMDPAVLNDTSLLDE